ncbi:poly(A)+ mRNA export from nucleus [Mactra antiquata]
MGNAEEPASTSRYNPYGRNNQRGGPRGRRKYDNSGDSSQRDGGYNKMARFGLPIRDGDGDSEWYKILIPWGKKAEKEFVLNSIKRLIDVPFVPTDYHFEEHNVVFHVNDKAAANAIRGVTKRITMPSGHKMNIIVKPSYPPVTVLSEEVIEKLKVCMSNRYDPVTKTLNLSSLHTDKDMVEAKYYISLARRQVMSNVVKIIKENIPELCSLDLSENKLMNVDDLSPLVPAAVDMKALKLSNNKITSIECLKRLKEWKLDVLCLDNNPLRDKFNDQSSYISAVRNIFPKVLKLDNLDLPPPITFDIEARTDLPKAKDNFFPSPEVQSVIVKFVKDYYMVYDSDDRTGLMGAYHDEALFSLSVAYNSAVSYKQTSLATYIDDSRNMAKAPKDGGRRQKLKLKSGNQVVSQLCLLPKTMHDPNTFMLDCGISTPVMMNFTVQGVFKETSTKSDNPPIRAFSRTFVTVPGGSGMLIINDMLTITNPSQDQRLSAFKNPAPTPSSSPVPQTAPVNNPFQGTGFTEIQQQMITSFMNDSRMNSEWSIKCLSQNDWSYEKAGQNFLELQQQGKIPQEAFNK